MELFQNFLELFEFYAQKQIFILIVGYIDVYWRLLLQYYFNSLTQHRVESLWKARSGHPPSPLF